MTRAAQAVFEGLSTLAEQLDSNENRVSEIDLVRTGSSYTEILHQLTEFTDMPRKWQVNWSRLANLCFTHGDAKLAGEMVVLQHYSDKIDNEQDMSIIIDRIRLSTDTMLSRQKRLETLLHDLKDERWRGYLPNLTQKLRECVRHLDGIDQVESLESLVYVQDMQLGPGSASTFGVLKDLSKSLIQSGRYQDAEAMLRRLLLSCQGEYGNRDPLTIEVMELLAPVSMMLGNFSKGMGLLTTVHEKKIIHLGTEHPSTRKSLHKLELLKRYVPS